MKARDLLLFHTLDKKVNVSVHFSDGTFWLNQKAIAELFGVNVPAVSKHLRNIFETGELDPDSVISKMETTVARWQNLCCESIQSNCHQFCRLRCKVVTKQ